MCILGYMGYIICVIVILWCICGTQWCLIASPARRMCVIPILASSQSYLDNYWEFAPNSFSIVLAVLNIPCIHLTTIDNLHF